MNLNKLTVIDWVGITVVTLLGIFIGWGIASASDIELTPMLVVLFPGLFVGFAVARVLGIAAGVLACAISNGAICGLALYGWLQLSNALALGIPKWLGTLGGRLSRRSSKT